MSTAKAIALDRQQRGCRSLTRDSILTVVMDEHTVIAMNEPMLDTWWESLEPELKAEIYEASLDAEPEQAGCPCIFCGPNSPLTPDRARRIEIFADEFQKLLHQSSEFLKRPVQ